MVPDRVAFPNLLCLEAELGFPVQTQKKKKKKELKGRGSRREDAFFFFSFLSPHPSFLSFIPGLSKVDGWLGTQNNKAPALRKTLEGALLLRVKKINKEKGRKKLTIFNILSYTTRHGEEL